MKRKVMSLNMGMCLILFAVGVLPSLVYGETAVISWQQRYDPWNLEKKAALAGLALDAIGNIYVSGTCAVRIHGSPALKSCHSQSLGFVFSFQ